MIFTSPQKGEYQSLQKQSKNKNFIFWAVAATGTGISGSDRIFIELARRWKKKVNIKIFVWKDGAEMIKRQKLLNDKKLDIKVIHISQFLQINFLICYLARIFEACRSAINIKIENPQNVITYNASEFWMDSFPCVILKIRYPKITWIASWYQTAPNPLKGYDEKTSRENKYFISALLYWISQQPVKILVNLFADKIIVNNTSEISIFPKQQKAKQVIVLIGAVPLEEINKYIKKHPKVKKVYDAVFQGRFHPQKGVVELVEIWQKVVQKKPNAKLVMIGDGPLMEEVTLKIKKLKLQNNIILTGYVFDGDSKYKIFSQSKLVMHPSFYDSGGMAAAEAMAFGSPGIAFDLKAYASYYPVGLVKTKTKNDFAKKVVELLSDNKKRLKIGNEAKKLIHTSYSWDMRAEEIYNKIAK